MKDRIRQIMEAKHLTQQNFASLIGISTASLSSIFNDRTKPTLNTVGAIKNTFPDISTDWLLYGIGPMTSGVGLQGELLPVVDNPQKTQNQNYPQNAPSYASQTPLDDASHSQASHDAQTAPSYTSQTAPSASTAYASGQASIAASSSHAAAAGAASDMDEKSVSGMDRRRASGVDGQRASGIDGRLSSGRPAEPMLAFDDFSQMPTGQPLETVVPASRSVRGMSFRQDAPQQVRPAAVPPHDVKVQDRPQRKITEIRIFYDDQTWETFVPKK